MGQQLCISQITCCYSPASQDLQTVSDDRGKHTADVQVMIHCNLFSVPKFEWILKEKKKKRCGKQGDAESCGKGARPVLCNIQFLRKTIPVGAVYINIHDISPYFGHVLETTHKHVELKTLHAPQNATCFNGLLRKGNEVSMLSSSHIQNNA